MDALEKRVMLRDSISIPRIHIKRPTGRLKKVVDMAYESGKFLAECIRPYDNRVYVAGLY